jgi:hypothetical protein
MSIERLVSVNKKEAPILATKERDGESDGGGGGSESDSLSEMVCTGRVFVVAGALKK